MNIREIPLTKCGGAETLRLRERVINVATDEKPGPNDVVITVKYSGVNFADIMMRIGIYPDAPPKPFIPGYEVSGSVEQVGSEVEGINPGDAVAAGTMFGGYSSRVIAPVAQVFPVPSSMTLEEGAALPAAFLTVAAAFGEMARIRPGDRVLIEAATGGVGTLAIQYARHRGAEVVGLTTTPQKKVLIERLGAQAHTLEEMRNDASIKDFDVIMNSSGGANITWQMDRLNLTGRIICIGLSSATKDGRRNPFRILWAAARTPSVSILNLFQKNRGIYGLNTLRLLGDHRWLGRLRKQIDDIDSMGLRPQIGKIYAAANIAEAHRDLETKRARGKLLLAW